MTRTGGKTRRERRLEVVEKLGNKCNRCGFNDIRILQVHHKEGVRNERRIKIWQYPLHKLECLCPNCHTLEHYPKDRKE